MTVASGSQTRAMRRNVQETCDLVTYEALGAPWDLPRIISRSAELRAAFESHEAKGDCVMAARAEAERRIVLLQAATLACRSRGEAEQKDAIIRRHGIRGMLLVLMLAVASASDIEDWGDLGGGGWDKVTHDLELPFHHTAAELVQALADLDQDIGRMGRRGAAGKARSGALIARALVLCLAATPARSTGECEDKLRALARHGRVHRDNRRIAHMLDMVKGQECARWGLTFNEASTSAGVRISVGLNIDAFIGMLEARSDKMIIDAVAELRWYGKSRNRRNRAALAA